MRKLQLEDPEMIVYGHLERGLTLDEMRQLDIIDLTMPVLKPYFEFLQESAESFFGNIVLFNPKEFLFFQYYIQDLTELAESWICIGKFIDSPLLLNLITGKVYIFLGYPSDFYYKELGGFEEFILKYVFGEKYSVLIPWTEEDDWCYFLKNILLVQ